MSDNTVLKWSGDTVIRFLNIYRNYEGLWDTNHENYIKRNSREDSFAKLFRELIAAGFKIRDEELLKKKIKNLKDSYRNEVNKIKKSIKSGAGTEDIYKPKLVWFGTADSFWRNVVSGRESSSNLDLSSLSQRKITDAYDSGDQEEDASDSLEITEMPNRAATQRAAMESSVSVVTESSQDQVDKYSFQHLSKPVKKKRSPEKMRAPESTKKGMKCKKTTKSASAFNTAVSKLHELAEMTNEPPEDQYDHFANHIASQLRELPLRSFIVLQDKIQSLITQERLATIHPLPSPHSFQSSLSTSTFQPSPGTSTFQPSPCSSNFQTSPLSYSNVNYEINTEDVKEYTELDPIQAALWSIRD